VSRTPRRDIDMTDILRKFGPKPYPSLIAKCPACGVLFAKGDYTTLIALGPGNDPEQQVLARQGRSYNAVAVEVHWACATGET
jgi:hypothetical protein